MKASKQTPNKKYTVCRWIKEIFPQSIDKSILTDLKIEEKNVTYWDDIRYINRSIENVPPSSMGTIVDLACRYLLTKKFFDSFSTIHSGICYLQETLWAGNELWSNPEALRKYNVQYSKNEYEEMLRHDKEKFYLLDDELRKGGLSDNAIILLTELIRYNNLYRGGFKAFKKEVITPNNETIANIRTMVERSKAFLEIQNGIQCGLYFTASAFQKASKSIYAGDGDYWTEDTIYDMKCQNSLGVHSDDIKQLAIYYLISKHDQRNKYKFKHCVLFNPRWGGYFKFDIKDLPKNFMTFLKNNI